MALWTPAAISTALWLDAADSSTLFDAVSGGSNVTTGNAVARWNDKSGNGRNVTQSNASFRPTYQSTGFFSKPTIDWGAVSSRKSLTVISTYTPGNICGVAVWDGASPFPWFEGLVSYNFTSNADIMISNQSTLNWFGGNQVFHNGASTSTQVALPTIASPFVFATNFLPNASRTTTYIGNDRDIGDFRGWRGRICEIIALGRSYVVDERNLVEGYLAWKWGLQANLPADHPYKNAAPQTGSIIPILRQHYAAQGAR
jgi:hypothetical protein